MNIQAAINHVVEGNDLERTEMQSIMHQIMTGACTDAQIGGLLIALRMKGETVNEIAAAAEAMVALADRVQINAPHLVDIVGTGGDGISTFNVSTAAAFVAAGAGATVAKHGNRSVSSKSGSADVLEAAGANLELSSSQVVEVIHTAGVGFMFAPMHHSAMKHAVGPRREMAVRTIFNVLGPLTNPAAVKRQVVGVYAKPLTETLAKVLLQLGSEHSLVVHAEGGMDEISICEPTTISELKDGQIESYSVCPEDFDLKRSSINSIIVEDAAASWSIIRSVLAGESGPARDIVLLNAGAGIYAAGLAESLAVGVIQAGKSIDEGKALAAKEDYVTATQLALGI